MCISKIVQRGDLGALLMEQPKVNYTVVHYQFLIPVVFPPSSNLVQDALIYKL